MAPVLFLFLMRTFAKTLELVWKERDIPILGVMTTANEHIAEGKICSHTPAMFKSKKLPAYEILQCLHVDDSAFPFGTREDLQRGMELTFHHFARFGLEMHIGCSASESKTECIFFPPPSVLPAPGEDQRHGLHNPTSIQKGTTSTRRGMHCGATCSPGPSTHHTSPITVSIDRELPHWMPCHCCFVPSTARQHNGVVIQHTAKFVIFAP